MKKKQKKIRKIAGRTVTVSPVAHEKILRESFVAEPRLSNRELINIKFGLPKEI